MSGARSATGRWTPNAGKRAWSMVFSANVDVLRVYPKSETATVRVACGGLRDGQWMTTRGHRWSRLGPAKSREQLASERRAAEAKPFMVECEECGGTGRTQQVCVECGTPLSHADVDSHPECDDLCRDCFAKDEGL